VTYWQTIEFGSREEKTLWIRPRSDPWYANPHPQFH